MKRLKVLFIVCLMTILTPCAFAQIFTSSGSAYGADLPSACMRSTSNLRGDFYNGTISVAQTYSPGASYGQRRAPGQPDDCDCHWEYDEATGTWVCHQCGHNIIDGCECDPCTCPVGDGTWAMMAMALAFGIVVALRRREDDSL